MRPEHVLMHSNISNNSLTRADASKPLHKSGSNTSSIRPVPARFKSISDLKYKFYFFKTIHSFQLFIDTTIFW